MGNQIGGGGAAAAAAAEAETSGPSRVTAFHSSQLWKRHFDSSKELDKLVPHLNLTCLLSCSDFSNRLFSRSAAGLISPEIAPPIRIRARFILSRLSDGGGFHGGVVRAVQVHRAGVQRHVRQVSRRRLRQNRRRRALRASLSLSSISQVFILFVLFSLMNLRLGL